jgi:tRNA (guanine37-N1)-methyltransferase
LRGFLPEDRVKLAVKGFDIIGDTAIIRIPKSLENERFLIAEALHSRLPYVKTVLRQVGAVAGVFRTRKLEWLWGEKKTTVSHKEHGCLFEVDLATTYFSPRLIHERARIAALCSGSKNYENILNMFSGVGCFSILIAKQRGKRHVYSVDLNPDAITCQLKNIRLNHVKNSVAVVFGGAKQVAESLFRGSMHRVLMPLPEKAYACLDSALTAVTSNGGTIHYYDFTHARGNEDPVEKITRKVALKLSAQARPFAIDCGRIVRTTGPNWYQVVLDITLT